MNTLGRQTQRSSAPVQHQRQYQDNFIDAPNKWLQSGNYQQDYGLFGAGEGGGGGGGIGSKWNRNLQKGLNSGNELSLDPSMPPFTRASTSSILQNADDGVSPNQYSPGLLDLHSFDTDFISEMPVRSPLGRQSLLSRGFEDAELTDRNDARARALFDNSLQRTGPSDKDKLNSVAKIKVVVRKRPVNKKEGSRKEGDIVTIDQNSSALTVHETKYKVDLTEYLEKHEFVFDAVLDEYVTNDEVYAETVEPIVPLIFQRTKATCFAYGQTGSGKTYTMQPLPLRASQDILSLMHHNFRNQGFQLYVGFFEIYGGKLFDLLNDRKNLFMREDGKKQVCIVGLQEHKVSDTGTIRDLIDKGNATRSTGTTGANEESSRSHAILQLAIKKSPDGNESKPPRVVGKLSFIDLAGSERGADTTDNDKQTRMEGAEINKSLLALKECIRALDNDQNHIPFRGSKLTEVLRDSFVGNSRTVMISCISPNSGSCEHTLNTLRYADRVKSLSKGSSSRRDQPSSTASVRESSTIPLSSGSASILNTEDSSSGGPTGSGRFGWPRDSKDPSPSISIDRVPSGRADSNHVSSDLYKGQKVGKGGEADEDLEYYLENLEAEKPIWTTRNKKADSYSMSISDERMNRNELQTRQWDCNSHSNVDYTKSHDDFNGLLKEEEDLVDAHRRLVEETIEIVREEMNLLVEVEQPGNQLDDYIFKLNTFLSQKASGIMQLQNRLANFKRRLNDHNVLVSSSSGR